MKVGKQKKVGIYFILMLFVLTGMAVGCKRPISYRRAQPAIVDKKGGQVNPIFFDFDRKGGGGDPFVIDDYDDLPQNGPVFRQLVLAPDPSMNKIQNGDLLFQIFAPEKVRSATKTANASECGNPPANPNLSATVLVCIGDTLIQFPASEVTYIIAWASVEFMRYIAGPPELTAYIGSRNQEVISARESHADAGDYMVLVTNKHKKELLDNAGLPGVGGRPLRPPTEFEINIDNILLTAVVEPGAFETTFSEGSDYDLQTGNNGTGIYVEDAVGFYMSEYSLAESDFSYATRSDLPLHWFASFRNDADDPMVTFAKMLAILNAGYQLKLESSDISCLDLPDYLGFKFYHVFIEINLDENPFAMNCTGMGDVMTLDLPTLKFSASYISPNPVGALVTVRTSGAPSLEAFDQDDAGIGRLGWETIQGNPLHTGPRVVIVPSPRPSALPASAGDIVYGVSYDIALDEHSMPNTDMKNKSVTLKPTGYSTVTFKVLYEDSSNVNGLNGPFYNALILPAIANLFGPMRDLRQVQLNTSGYATSLELPKFSSILAMGSDFGSHIIINGIPYTDANGDPKGDSNHKDKCGTNIEFNYPGAAVFYRYGIVTNNISAPAGDTFTEEIRVQSTYIDPFRTNYVLSADAALGCTDFTVSQPLEADVDHIWDLTNGPQTYFHYDLTAK